jgi:hypothetical protein
MRCVQEERAGVCGNTALPLRCIPQHEVTANGQSGSMLSWRPAHVADQSGWP